MVMLLRLFLRTKFSFWLACFLSKVLTLFYSFWTQKIAPVKRHETLKDVEESLNRLVWAEDKVVVLGVKLRHFWMRSAEEIQWHLDQHDTPQTDCDEFAIYAAKALGGIEEALEPGVLMVRWTNGQGLTEGHNMAVYSYPSQDGVRLYGHIGNWGHFRGFNSVAKIVESVGNFVGARPIAYALVSPDLKLIAYEKL
jgi:hypothetical protein